MSTDLDALLREPDDFEKRLFAIEKALHLVEDCRSAERQLIRDLAHALAEEDEEDAPRYMRLDRSIVQINQAMLSYLVRFRRSAQHSLALVWAGTYLFLMSWKARSTE